MSNDFLIPVARPRPATDSGASITADGPGEWHRMHPSALLFGLFGLVRRVIDLVPAVAALGLSGNAHFIPLAAGAYLLVHCAAVILRWRFTLYQVGDDAITLRHGIFSRNQRHIGFDRVQDISIEQGVIARFFGVAKLGVETGAGGSGDDDLKLSAIAMPKALALREDLRAYRAEQASAPLPPADACTNAEHAPGTPAITPPASVTLFSMPPRTLLLSGVFSPSLVVIAFVFAIIGLADRFKPFGYEIGNPRQWGRLARESGYGDWIAQQYGFTIGSAAIAIGLLGLLLGVLGIVTGIVRTVFRDWDYRLTRETRALRRTRGLTTRTDVAITIRRIQSATVTTGWLRQKLGWFELRLRSLASDVGSASGGGDHQALPFARASDIDQVLTHITLLPDWSALTWHRSHGLIALPTLLFSALLCLIGTLAALILTPLGWIASAGGLFFAVMAPLAARRHCYAVEANRLLIRCGLFRRSTTIIPFASIQSADIRDNFVYRRYRLATLALGVPGISASADDVVAAIPHDAAMALRARILSQDKNL